MLLLVIHLKSESNKHRHKSVLTSYKYCTNRHFHFWGFIYICPIPQGLSEKTKFLEGVMVFRPEPKELPDKTGAPNLTLFLGINLPSRRNLKSLLPFNCLLSSHPHQLTEVTLSSTCCPSSPVTWLLPQDLLQFFLSGLFSRHSAMRPLPTTTHLSAQRWTFSSRAPSS